MYKLFDADKDTYITDKVISGVKRINSSVGYASTLDLFKLYGITTNISGATQTPNVEISRSLLHFEGITDLKNLLNSKKIDINHESFKCYVNLKDVYGGQTTPNNFSLILSPLSKSFSEGIGKDIVYLTDFDVANFLSASENDAWILSGANYGGQLGDVCDYFTNGIIGSENINFEITQSFKNGSEDALFDVTKIVSATLINKLPDEGYRLSFIGSVESNQQTYFVKRFASRHAYDLTLRPKLIVKFDDSISDDSSIMNFNLSGSLFLYNYDSQGLRNINFESNDLTGSNCLLLKLTTPISGGNYDIFFTGSQFSRGNFELSGTYQAPVYVSLNPILQKKLNVSGSVTFTPIWMSLNQSSSFVTGSSIKFSGPQTFTSPLNKKKYTVSCYGVPIELKKSEKMLVRIHIFDQTNPLLQSVKFAINDYGKIIKNCYYSIRDEDSSNTVIPFDTTYNSTKLSLDSNGLYFYLDGFSLIQNRSYTIDIMTVEGNESTIYKNSSITFKVVS